MVMKDIELIKNIYSKLKYSRLKRLMMLIFLMVAMVAVFSLFLGNPFPHKYSIVISEVWVEGWLTRDIILSYVIIILSAVLTIKWDAHRARKMLVPLMNLVLEECNATRLVEISKKGIDYAIENNLKAEKRALQEFEYLYIFALNALGKFEETINYLENDWHSAKRKIYRMYVLQMKLNIAARDEKVELYHTLYSQAPKVLNKNFSFLLQSKVVDGKYAEAIALIGKEQGKNKPLCSLYQVRDMYYKAKCYKQMGDLEKAKSCFDYVIDNGGDLMYKQFAIELYEQIKNDKNNC